jgi:crotonobetainyl-CoA:carnitine CoA-transferase CaiB-like acyl-CoA transferase
MMLAAALEGLRVLDLSQGVAGPYATSILQQQGADVVKLEPPYGDWARKAGHAKGNFTAPVIAYNAGKRALCLDLRTPQGVQAAQRIAGQVDVVVQNFRPGVAARLGLGQVALTQTNTRLVYVSISGFGVDGPLVDAPATDTVLQSMSGMMHANRGADGHPRRIPMHLADIATAVYAAQMTVAALFQRERRGVGMHVEVSLLQACAAFQSANIVQAAMNPHAPDASSAPSGVFATADGAVSLACVNDRMFDGLCDALDKPEWKRDLRFVTMADRLRHAAELNAQTAACLVRRPSTWWTQRLQRHDVLNSESVDYAGFVAHPQSVQQGIFAAVEQPGIGQLPFARHPGTAIRGMVAPAPECGADNDAVLADYGFAPDEIARLRDSGALVDPKRLQ